jgi:hypothetical protein
MLWAVNDATEPGTMPVASSDDTVSAILGQGNRDHSPVRIAFLQRSEGGKRVPGPLAQFVTTGDRRGIALYLLLIGKATTEPWDAALPAAVWARALGIPFPTSKTATSSVSKTWLRLEQRRLVKRSRWRRMAKVTLLREDGSGAPYTHPAREGGYFKLPHAFWLTGPATDQRWQRVLSLAEIAMLLIASSHKPRFRLPFEYAPAWYGISADTAARGLHGLESKGLLAVDRTFKLAPLAPEGYTSENLYTLLPPFAHRREAPPRRVAAVTELPEAVEWRG